MKQYIFVLCFSLYAAAAHGLTPAPENFQYRAEISGPFTNNGVYSVPLPGEVIRKGAAGMTDLRLYDSRNREVPFILLDDRKPAEKEEIYTLKITGYEERKGQEIITAAMPDRAKAVTRFEFATAGRNFRKRILIEGRNGTENWQKLSDDTLYDFSARVNLRKTMVKTDLSSFRTYRFTLTDEPGDGTRREGLRTRMRTTEFELSITSGTVTKNIRIDGITASTGSETEKDVIFDNSVFSAFSQELDKDNRTVITFEAELPADRIIFSVTTPYYHRNVTVSTSDTGKNDSFVQAARGTIYAFPMRNTSESRDYIDCRIPKRKFFRIAIENKNDPPLEIGSIRFEWIRKNMFFIASGDTQSYTAAFGAGTDMAKPVYDIGNFISQANWHTHSFSTATIGPVAANQSYKPFIPGAAKARTEKHILTGVVIVVVGILGFWLYSLLGKTGTRKAP